MKDRIPTYPNRVRLTPVSGQANTYDLVRADAPTEEGTPLNKSTLLTDATAALFGFNGNATVNDILNSIGQSQVKAIYGSYVGTGVFGSDANATRVVLPFTPKIFGVQSGFLIGIANRDAYSPFYRVEDNTTMRLFYIKAYNNTVAFYIGGGNDNLQFNGSGKTYHYFALGWED